MTGHEGNGGGAVTGEIDDGGGAVSIKIRCFNGVKFAVQVSLDSSVESFKSVIAQKCDVPTEQQRVIYKGRILKDDQTLKIYGIKADSTVHLLRWNVANNSSGTTTATDPMSCVEIRKPMDNIDAIMEATMRDPRARLLRDRNPDFAYVLNNPNVFRETIKAVRNPQIVRQILSTTNMKFSNIKLPPQAINLIRRIYGVYNHQSFLNEPMRNESSDDLTKSLTHSGPNTTPLPNPWLPAPRVLPEQLYAGQLAQLREMGFSDATANLRALVATSGDVRAAIQLLLTN